MNPRTRIGLLIAMAGLALIVLGVYGAMRLLNIGLAGPIAPAAPTPPAETIAKVVMTTRDIAEGTVLLAEDVSLVEAPIELAPRDVLGNVDLAIGRMTKTDLFQGEMVLEHNLADPTGQMYDLAYILDERHVLMALGIGDLMTREALIKRGDIVDLLATYNPGEQLLTFDSFERLEITAMVVDIVEADNADRTQQAPAGPLRSQVAVQAYLLALEPQSALVIKYLRDTGAIFDLVLRAPTSTGRFELTPVTAQYIRELYGLELLP